MVLISPSDLSGSQVPFWVPILATFAAIFMILAPVIYDPKLEYLYAFVLLALGLVVYFVFIRGERQLPFMSALA